MNNEQMINDIYNNVTNVVLKNIDSKYREEFMFQYRKYLTAIYSHLDISGKDLNKITRVFIDSELSNFNKTSYLGLLSQFLKDSAMEELKYICQEGNDLAKKRIIKWHKYNNYNNLPTTIDEKKALDNIEKMKVLINEVREFNKELAKNLIAEAIIDYKYASGQSDYVSLKIGRLRRQRYR